MANHIFLSAASIRKVCEGMKVEYCVDLPLNRKGRISAKEIHLDNDHVRLAVHTNIPLANDFDIVLTDFRCQGTVVNMRFDHIGVIPSPLISVLGLVAGALLRNALCKTAVSVDGDQVTVDFGGCLPIPFKDINVTSLVVHDGLEIAFDY